MSFLAQQPVMHWTSKPLQKHRSKIIFLRLELHPCIRKCCKPVTVDHNDTVHPGNLGSYVIILCPNASYPAHAAASTLLQQARKTRLQPTAMSTCMWQMKP